LAAGPEPTAEDIERLQQLAETHDPRRLREGQRRTLTLTERDLDLWIAHALETLPGLAGVRVRTAVGPDRARLAASVQVPSSPLGRYLNVDTELGPEGDGLAIRRLKLGRLELPGALAESLLALALAGAPPGLRADIG